MNHSLLTLVLSVLASVSCACAETSSLNNTIESKACKQWVDSVYNTLSETERIAQLMAVNIAPNKGDASRTTIKNMVANNHVGGIFFSKGTMAQMAEMTNYAQSISKVPLMISIDGEWGLAMRVTDAPHFPYNMGLGAIQDENLLYQYGREMARECRELGIHIDYAPVLDVNSNPKNPVIGKRSFGEDPKRVAKLGVAYSLGLEDGGVMAVGKHFPGHGDTNTDSHKALPTINHSESTLNDVDLYPFKKFIEANCSGVMVGHLSVPALDKSGTPASMSHKITTGLLKDKMGYKGLVFTDGLGMKGAVTKENLCVAAILAGHDVLVGPTNVAADIQAVKKAVADGKIPAKVIEERCKRVLAYKYALGLNHYKPINTKGLSKRINNAHQATLIQQLANAMITVVRDKNHLLPIGDLAHNKIAVVNIGEMPDNTFANYCRRYANVDVYSSHGAPLTANTVSAIMKHDIVIAAVYNDDASSRTALASLKAAKNLVPVFMTGAYTAEKFSQSLASAPAIVLAYDNTKYSQQAAAMAIFGGIDVNGKLPVNLAGIGKMGEGVEYSKTRLGYSSPDAKGLDANLTTRLDSVVNAAMNNGAFPGAQLVVVKNGDVIVDRSYGYTTKGGTKVDFNTIYDLASVSKTVGTLPGVMKAYDLGLFELDKSAAKYIPGLNTPDKKDITPRMLLHHETGIPAALNMFITMMDTATYKGKLVSNKRDADHTIYINGGGYGHKSAKLRTDIQSPTRTDEFNIEAAKGIYTGKATYDTIMATIYRSKVNPARKFLYSCLNFCLLMDLEQRVTHQPHQTWVTDSVWAPLGAYLFCYRPTERFPLTQIAATEQDTYLRKQHMHGYVHDELANFSGGVQGNAGVFGSANDIAKLCQMWLNDGTYGDARVLSEKTSHLFTTEKSKTCRRGLGFDKPDMKNKDNSPTCDEASAATYGHTGFTGTCFWVDPEEDLIFVFLSNRVDPSRSNKAFSQSLIRPTLMSMVYQAMKK